MPPSSPPLHLAALRMWEEAVHIFVEQEEAFASEEAPALASVESVGPSALRDDARGTAAFLGGYCVAKERARAEKAKMGQPLQMLERLVQPAEEALPASDQATVYILVRERFAGRLTRLRPAAVTAFHLAQEKLHSQLTPQHIRQHGNRTYDRAEKAVRADAGVRDSFLRLLLQGSTAAARAETSAVGKRGAEERPRTELTPDRDQGGVVQATEERQGRQRAIFLSGGRERQMLEMEQELNAEAELEAEAERAVRSRVEADLEQMEEELQWEERCLREMGLPEEELGEALEAEEVPSDGETGSDAVTSDEAAETWSDLSAAEAVLRRLLTRLFNTCGKEFRQHVLLIAEAAKSDASVALRMRLKVAQCKEAAADAPVTISEKRGDLRLPRHVLFELLVQVAEHAADQLHSLKLPQIERLVYACCTSDADAKRRCSSLKEAQVASLKAVLLQCAASDVPGFARPEMLEKLECFKSLCVQATPTVIAMDRG
jgi:hypothetical protein